jgi:predicted nucleotidyltransferase component of viral defense system
MKDLLLSAISDESDPLRRRNKAREYLQARILLSLQDHGAFSSWAFLGGTSLRFLFDLPRYSEDLDFSVSKPGADARFVYMMKAVKDDFSIEAYDVDVRVREQKTLAAALVKFRGILYEIGASPLRDEVLSVKVEIDTNPPAGAALASKVIRKHVLLNLQHYDKGSLFSGKLHALLARKYIKGRDVYDLLWYLSDPSWPAPNLELLNNALRQTDWQGEDLSAETWRQFLAKRLSNADWKQVRADVSPFLERKQEEAMLTPDTFSQLLGCRV